MHQLNYSHLHYFWAVANEGSIARASEQLHLTPQTISGQLRLLEQAVGEPLFNRVGRGLVLTDTGNLVKHYADEIFSLGTELSQRIRDKSADSALPVKVGLVDSIPKLVVYRLLKPLLENSEPVKLNCIEGKLDQLVGDLALHKLDILFSDTPLPAGFAVKAYNHRLGASRMGLFVQKKISRKYIAQFPQSLNNADFLLPVTSSVLRRNLDDWFQRVNVTPHVVAEFADSALLKVFGEAGTGVFPACTAISEEIEQMYHAKYIGTAEGVTETYYAISAERKLKNPAIVRINDAAHEWLDD